MTRPERLVGAMLTPGLGQDLDLDVGDVAAETLVLVADHPQLLDVEVQRPLVVECGEPLVVEPADGDQGRGRLRWRVVHMGGLDRSLAPAFDHRIGDQTAHDLIGRLGRDVGVELDAPPGCGPVDHDAELRRGMTDCVGSGVGHPWQERDLDSG